MFEHAQNSPFLTLLRGGFFIIYGINFLLFVFDVYPTATFTVITGGLLLVDAVLIGLFASRDRKTHPTGLYITGSIFTFISGIALVLLTAPTHLFTLHFVALALVLTGILQLWASMRVIKPAPTLLLMRAFAALGIIIGVVLPVVPISQDMPLLIALALFLMAKGGALIYWTQRDDPVAVSDHLELPR